MNDPRETSADLAKKSEGVVVNVVEVGVSVVQEGVDQVLLEGP